MKRIIIMVAVAAGLTLTAVSAASAAPAHPQATYGHAVSSPPHMPAGMLPITPLPTGPSSGSAAPDIGQGYHYTFGSAVYGGQWHLQSNNEWTLEGVNYISYWTITPTAGQAQEYQSGQEGYPDGNCVTYSLAAGGALVDIPCAQKDSQYWYSSYGPMPGGGNGWLVWNLYVYEHYPCPNPNYAPVATVNGIGDLIYQSCPQTGNGTGFIRRQYVIATVQ